MTDSVPLPITNTENAPDTTTAVQQTSPDVQSSSTVPHGMPLGCQIAVVVGCVHEKLTYRTMARALGYRSLNIPYRRGERSYASVQVLDVFVYLKSGAVNGRLQGEQNIYGLWGPDYDAVVDDELRIRRGDIEYQKSLISEALQREEFIQSVQDLYREELKRRRNAWRRTERLGDAEWREEDEEEVLWNGLAQRESNNRSFVETASTASAISTVTPSIQQSDWRSAVSTHIPSSQHPPWEIDAGGGPEQPGYIRDRKSGRRGPGQPMWAEIPMVPGYQVLITTRKKAEDGNWELKCKN